MFVYQSNPMNYTKILLLQASAQTAFKNQEINRTQYLKILEDLSNNINEVDTIKVNEYLKELIKQ